MQRYVSLRVLVVESSSANEEHLRPTLIVVLAGQNEQGVVLVRGATIEQKEEPRG